jgi:hypothetical protein
MLSICRENPEICNVKESSLKDFQPPVVLIKQKAHFRPIFQKAINREKPFPGNHLRDFFQLLKTTINYYKLV